MGNHKILDALVNLTGDDAILHQILFGAIGPKANNAFGPTARHSRSFQQLFNRGVIEVDARLGRWGICGGLGSSVGVAILILRSSDEAD